jgi:hypothetical protein
VLSHQEVHIGISVYYPLFILNLEIWVELYSWHYAAFTTSSSQEYWQETMFVALLFHVSTINNIHIIESANTIHTILII